MTSSMGRRAMATLAREDYGGYLSEYPRHHFTLDGEPVTKLYRIVHPQEWAEAQERGFLQSRDGWTRATAAPDERYRSQPTDTPGGFAANERGITLEIDWSIEDKWSGSAEGFAATHERIPLSRVRVVGSKAVGKVSR